MSFGRSVTQTKDETLPRSQEVFRLSWSERLIEKIVGPGSIHYNKDPKMPFQKGKEKSQRKTLMSDVSDGKHIEISGGCQGVRSSRDNVLPNSGLV
ncbi:hypothetical protein D918_07897 [Trichuris suis]|nr:hypothetical protein D918_07897 [Trichuris suis]